MRTQTQSPTRASNPQAPPGISTPSAAWAQRNCEIDEHDFGNGNIQTLYDCVHHGSDGQDYRCTWMQWNEDPLQILECYAIAARPHYHGQGGLGGYDPRGFTTRTPYEPAFSGHELSHLAIRHPQRNPMNTAPRIRPRRPIMNALKNPCAMRPNPGGPEFPVQPQIPQIQLKPGAFKPIQVQFPQQPAQPAMPQAPQQQPQFQPQQFYNYPPYAYPPYVPPFQTDLAAPTSSWLPASSGPRPQGAQIWVVWQGGARGTKHFAGSALTEDVQILEQIAGGPTGIQVRTAPLGALLTNPGPQVRYDRTYGYGSTRAQTGQERCYRGTNGQLVCPLKDQTGTSKIIKSIFTLPNGTICWEFPDGWRCT